MKRNVPNVPNMLLDGPGPEPGWNLPPGVSPITQVQPQIAQLELFFSGPLVKDSVVEKFEDLANLKSKYNYQHKRVWVKEYGCEYYLSDGDGTDLSCWKRSIGRMVVQKWNKDETYQAGDICSIGGKLYYAIIDVPKGMNPVEHEDYWQVVTGEIETYRYLFFNTSSVIIYTEIRNPIFEVILGDIVYDDEDNVVLNPETGLAELENKEIIIPCIYQREDLIPKDGELLPNDQGGIPYEICFYEDEKPKIMKSGCINIK